MSETNNMINSHSLPECSICKSEGSLIYTKLNDRLFGTSGKWNIKKCNNKDCGQLWLDPMPNIEDIGKAYENYYTHDAIASNIIPFLRPFEKGYLALRFGYDENVSFLQKMAGLFIYLLPTEKAEIDYSVLYFSKKEIGKLLDIGCGNGSFISRMKNLGWKVEGIDFDSKAVNYCNERGLDVKCGDLAQQNFENDCYDVITINHVIEHVPDAGQLIEECYRILKPGGCLVIATPNTESWIHKTIFKENYFSLDPPRHLFLFLSLIHI